MSFFYRHKFLFIIVSFFVIVGITLALYYGVVQVQAEKIRQQEYQQTALKIQDEVADAIVLKQKATLAIAIALASQENLQKHVRHNIIPKHYFNAVIKKFRQKTLYENIWIQIIDKHGKSLYRSWTKENGDNLVKVRNDIKTVQKIKQTASYLSAGYYDLSIKAMIPILYKGEYLGIFELISHFNSIAKNFQEDGLESVVVATKEASKHIKHPFSKLFVGEYYVANLNAKQQFRELLEKYGIENIAKKPYSIRENYLIVPYALKDSRKKIIGYYFIFQKIETLSNKELEHFTFKWIVLGLFFFSLLGAFVSIILYIFVRKQQKYYKRIIDTSKNIIIINDKKKILEANQTFFKYFKHYKTLEEFRKENSCICNFFVEEEGYLSKEGTMYKWLDSVLRSPDVSHKVKMNIEGKIYYFLVSASLIDAEREHYSVVFSDITQEEIFKNELQQSVITDPLTGIYNRRYYYEKIQKEMYEAKRYGLSLSVIMTDIDFFKKINDTHGHDVGDEVLKHYTKIIQESLRKSDTFCRIGGEEFIIILPHTNKEQAVKIAEKLRKSIETSKKIVPITMSFGVTEYIRGESEDYLFKRVDNALYRAKKNGRNRVEVE